MLKATFDHPYPTTKIMWIPDQVCVYMAFSQSLVQLFCVLQHTCNLFPGIPSCKLITNIYLLQSLPPSLPPSLSLSLPPSLSPCLPLQTGQLPDLVATAGDYLRLWRVTDSDVRQECMLNNVSEGRRVGGKEGGRAISDQLQALCHS